jgi:hypothetical protein
MTLLSRLVCQWLHDWARSQKSPSQRLLHVVLFFWNPCCWWPEKAKHGICGGLLKSLELSLSSPSSLGQVLLWGGVWRRWKGESWHQGQESKQERQKPRCLGSPGAKLRPLAPHMRSFKWVEPGHLTSIRPHVLSGRLLTFDWNSGPGQGKSLWASETGPGVLQQPLGITLGLDLISKGRLVLPTSQCHKCAFGIFLLGEALLCSLCCKSYMTGLHGSGTLELSCIGH